jgi:hypothetical protein
MVRKLAHIVTVNCRIAERPAMSHPYPQGRPRRFAAARLSGTRGLSGWLPATERFCAAGLFGFARRLSRAHGRHTC